MTPTALDYLGDYKDSVEYMQIVIDTTENTSHARVFVPGPADGDPPDNAHPGTRTRRFLSHPNDVLAFDQNRPTGNTYEPKSRGSWAIKKIWTADGTAPDIGDNEVLVQVEVCEPLLLSPFVFGSGDGKQGHSDNDLSDEYGSNS